MRKAISIVLAALLIVLPVEQVLAQASQQEAASVQQTVPSDGAANLFRVPPLTENSARLLGGSSERAPLNRDLTGALFVQEDPGDGLSTLEEWAIGLGVVVVAGAAVGGAVAWGENNNPNSFKSKHNVFYGIGYGGLVAVPAIVLGAAIVALFYVIARACGDGSCPP